MARGRMLNQTIATDKKLNELSMEAEFVYLKTIPHLDRDGLILGEPMPLWAQICPRRSELMPRITGIIDELIASGLVVAYSDNGDTILLFPGFTKNQGGMRYDREAPSRFGAPPGYTRTPTGMIQSDSTPMPQPEKTPSCAPRTTDEPAPDELRTNSGLTPDEVPPKVSIKEEKVSRRAGGVTPPEQQPPAATPAPFVQEYERVWALSVDSPYRAQQIDDWARRVTIDGWSYALKECADHSKVGQWRYFETILKRVESEGVPKTVPKQKVSGNVSINLATI